MSVSRIYVDAVTKRPDEYHDYVHYNINWGYECISTDVRYSTINRYELIQSVGRGKFSEVFKAYDTENNEYVSVKHLKPVRKDKIKKEIFIMQILKNGPSILPILDVVKGKEIDGSNIVTKWVTTLPYRELYAKIDDHKFRYYMYKVLIGLDYAHSHGIIHRDIKPQNVLIDINTDEVYIIDWGLADFYIPNHKLKVHVSTRNYKGPELLANNYYYDYCVDIWSFGCMIAGIVFNRLPFFRAHGNVDQLCRIAEVLGTDDLFKYIKDYNLEVDAEVLEKLGTWRKCDWSEFASGGRSDLICTELYDLLDNILIYDHHKRFTAQECMQHPYFDKVRDEVEAEMKQKYEAANNITTNLEDMSRGLKDRAEYCMQSGNYKLVSFICNNLSTIQNHIDLIKQNPTPDTIAKAQKFLDTQENMEF